MYINLRFIYFIPLLIVISTDRMYVEMGINTDKIAIVLAAVTSLLFVREFPPFLRSGTM
ncbi:MAG: hypothetical protein HC880_10575 [Bacteroidia bacterium]|nr:hypothetical protein [Bacteroidia bacterium]